LSSAVFNNSIPLTGSASIGHTAQHAHFEKTQLTMVSEIRDIRYRSVGQMANSPYFPFPTQPMMNLGHGSLPKTNVI